jgi:hypothetical protein
MRGWQIALVVIVGCADTGTPPPADGASTPAPLVNDPDPSHCAHVALDGSTGSSTPTVAGPWTLGVTTLCLHLDASQNRYAHFMAGTKSEPGTTSSFSMTLADPSTGTTVVSGWDVSIGQTDTTTYENLELPIDGGTVRDLLLQITAHPGTQAETPLSLALFERLE